MTDLSPLPFLRPATAETMTMAVPGRTRIDAATVPGSGFAQEFSQLLLALETGAPAARAPAPDSAATTQPQADPPPSSTLLRALADEDLTPADLFAALADDAPLPDSVTRVLAALTEVSGDDPVALALALGALRNHKPAMSSSTPVPPDEPATDSADETGDNDNLVAPSDPTTHTPIASPGQMLPPPTTPGPARNASPTKTSDVPAPGLVRAGVADRNFADPRQAPTLRPHRAEPIGPGPASPTPASLPDRPATPVERTMAHVASTSIAPNNLAAHLVHAPFGTGPAEGAQPIPSRPPANAANNTPAPSPMPHSAPAPAASRVGHVQPDPALPNSMASAVTSP